MRRWAAPLAPPRTRPGPACLAIGLAVATLLLALAAALLLGRAADPARRLVVQAAASDPGAAQASAAAALARLKGSPLVREAHPVAPEDVARLLGTTADGPVPRLIDATLAHGADTAAVAALVTRDRAVTVTAPAAPAAAFPRALRRLALLAALAAAAGLASAPSFDRNRAATVAILAEIGATDMQVARHVAQDMLPDALAGAAGGLLAATLLILLATTAGAAPLLAAGDWLLLVLAALAAAAAAVGAAFARALLALRRLP